MNCEPCGKSFTGMASYNQHMDSVKHKRKMLSLDMLKNMKENHSNELLANEAVSQPVNTQNSISCSVCDLTFDSVESFQRHVSSLKHAIKVCNSENQTNNTNKISCSICNISFDSLQSFTSHSESLEHATNVSTKFTANSNNISCGEIDSTVPNNFSSEASTVLPGVESDTILQPVQGYGANYLASFADCKVCSKQFSGPEPYKQHLVSAAHKRKVEMQSYSLNIGVIQNITCEPCKKVFSGHIPYQQHLASEIHKKKLQSIQLLKEWSGKEIKPDIVIGDSLDSGNLKTGGCGLNDKNVNHPWFCKICLVQCSGYIPYQQHLDGESHFKNVRRAEAPALGTRNTPLLSSYSTNTVFPLPTLQVENVQTEVTVQNIGKPSNAFENMEVDTILPLAIQNLVVVSPDELNLKEFMPEDSINFDKSENNEVQNTTNAEDVSEKSEKVIEEVKSEVYQECKYCNVQLKSKDDALSHFESLEHVGKRWKLK